MLESSPVLDSEVIASLRELEMFDELANAFLLDLPQRLEAVRAAFDVDGADREALEDAAHALKGSSLAIGASRLSAASAQLQEQACSATRDENKILIVRVETEAQVARDALTALIGGAS